MACLYKRVGDRLEHVICGSDVRAIKWKDNGAFDSVVDSKPVVGCSLYVGTATAATYSNDMDYWLTTVVTAVELDEPGRVEFTTQNSSYVLSSVQLHTKT